jgi:hypothetical protein
MDLARYFQARLAGFHQETVAAPLKFWSIFDLAAPQTDDIPVAGGERFHFNLWLHDGLPPAAEDQTFTVKIDRFEFTPLPLAIQSLRPKIEIKEMRNSSSPASTEIKFQLTVPAE